MVRETIGKRVGKAMRKRTRVRIRRILLILTLLAGAAGMIYVFCRFLLLRQAIGLLAAASVLTAVWEQMEEQGNDVV